MNSYNTVKLPKDENTNYDRMLTDLNDLQHFLNLTTVNGVATQSTCLEQHSGRVTGMVDTRGRKEAHQSSDGQVQRERESIYSSQWQSFFQKGTMPINAGDHTKQHKIQKYKCNKTLPNLVSTVCYKHSYCQRQMQRLFLCLVPQNN